MTAIALAVMLRHNSEAVADLRQGQRKFADYTSYAAVVMISFTRAGV